MLNLTLDITLAVLKAAAVAVLCGWFGGIMAMLVWEGTQIGLMAGSAILVLVLVGRAVIEIGDVWLVWTDTQQTVTIVLLGLLPVAIAISAIVLAAGAILAAVFH